MYVVAYYNLDSRYKLYCGGRGLDVNAGVMQAHCSTISRSKACRFAKLATAQRKARDCNDRWGGVVEDDATGEIVWKTKRALALRL